MTLTAANGAAMLYVLAFSKRTKIGIAAETTRRLKQLVWEHEKLAHENPLHVAITMPTPWARKIESQVLKQYKPHRLAGEYLAVEFDTVCTALELTWEKNAIAAASTALWVGGRSAEQPRFYRTVRKDTPFQICWADPTGRKRNGRRVRIAKWFSREDEANEYFATVTDSWRAGILKEQTDAAQALNLLRGEGITLTELAAQYLARR